MGGSHTCVCVCVWAPAMAIEGVWRVSGGCLEGVERVYGVSVCVSGVSEVLYGGLRRID